MAHCSMTFIFLSYLIMQGAFFDVREDNAKSSLGSFFGSLAKGAIVDGLGGAIEGVAHMVADPIGT